MLDASQRGHTPAYYLNQPQCRRRKTCSALKHKSLLITPWYGTRGAPKLFPESGSLRMAKATRVRVTPFLTTGFEPLTLIVAHVTLYLADKRFLRILIYLVLKR